jgi:hypothetical protein
LLEFGWMRHGGLWGWVLREKSLARGHDGGDACGHQSLAGGAIEVVLLPPTNPLCPGENPIPLGMGGGYASGMVPFALFRVKEAV